MTYEGVTEKNQRFVDQIFAGETAQYWVHHNWYWQQKALEHGDIDFKLICVADADQPVGVIAYGQHYRDEALTQPVAGVGEVIHTVIDVSCQRRGYGREATQTVIEILRPAYTRIVIAHNPANEAARKLYESLGFRAFGKNYDGDTLLELEPE